ncbi:MAG: SUMF1/EgtB/PvdO family nonheme iron enzyme [Alistipes sp.]|nr:SUMF1/EgtB/PvdO family nonheme iron enzyme [Alistipes sp.]
MRKFIFLLLVLLPFVASAQMERSIVIDESSFAPVQTDVMSGVPIDKIGKDRSNRECARIKMRINRMTAAEIDELSVRPFGGNVEVMKCVVATEGNGLIIEMTAKQPTRFYITHPKYGDSNEVSFNLSGGKEYRVDAELRLQHTIVVASNFANVEVYVDGVYKGVTDSNYMLSIGDVTLGEHKIKLQQGSLVSEQTVNVSSADISFRINLDHVAARPQYVIFEVEPKWANVVVDGKSYVPDQYGLVTIVLSNGVYNYSVSANDYYSTSGTLQVQGAKVEKSISLKPAFGWLYVPDSGDLNGANVFVDGTHIGTAPLKSAGIKSGEHKVRIMKTMYKVCEQTIVINDGETLTFAPKLEPDFADVTINAGAGCQIYVDNEFKGTTTWSGRLTSGSHMLESRKDSHRSTSVAKSVMPGSSRLVFTLADPTPIMGTLNVISTPGMADVYVDGVLVGRTPLMHDALVGSRDIVIRKQGFGDYKQSVRVEEGNVVDVVATMAEYKESKNKTYVETAKGLNLKMIYVEGGTFAMGSTSGGSDEEPVHNVTLDSYYIGETEITQAQWRAVMGSNPSSYTGDNRPVERVSWDDAQAFCKRLSELTGKRYVLPTEAQWEYAARGGKKSKGYTYSGSNSVDEVAKYSSSEGHANVKSKKPNELGIYDMSGNVWEWCSDWYDSYGSSSQTNPQGSSSGSDRVLRGGSWRGNASGCRVANRNSSAPSSTDSSYGFRVVCFP